MNEQMCLVYNLQFMFQKSDIDSHQHPKSEKRFEGTLPITTDS